MSEPKRVELRDLKKGRRYHTQESGCQSTGTAEEDARRIENQPDRSDGWACRILDDETGRIVDYFAADRGGGMYVMIFTDITDELAESRL